MPFQRKKPEAIGVKANIPGFVEPALATSIAMAPSGERWLHEIKLDGYRIQLHIANEAVRVFTRNGYDWTNRFKKEDRRRRIPNQRALSWKQSSAVWMSRQHLQHCNLKTHDVILRPKHVPRQQPVTRRENVETTM